MSGDGELTIQVLQDLVDPKNPALLDKLGKAEGLAESLHSNLRDGLTPEQVEINREKYGKNDLPEAESKAFLELVIDGFEDKTLIMLSISSVVSLVLGIRENPSTGWIEGTAILVAVLIVVFVTAANDYEKEKQFRALNAKKEMREIKVIRNGQQTQVLVDELVVGDIVSVETGDILPADGVLVFGSNLECDESAATGESDMVKKGFTAKHDPFFISGAQVMDGVGRMIVTAVGVNSFNGKQMMGLRVATEETPLQAKLADLADDIGYFGLVMAVITVVCLLVREVYTYYSTDRPIDAQFVSAIVRFIITGITILVVAIPEGLPLAVTMALAYSTIKMLEDNNLVRRLEACETMGGATTICSDKTGTLTQNKMEVVKGYVTRMHIDLENKSETPYQDRDVSKDVLRTIAEAIALNSTAYQPAGEKFFVGNKTESALIKWISKLGFDYHALRKKTDYVQVYPFSSARKRMSTLVRHSNGKLRLYVKGAAELILECCDRQLLKDGSVVPIDAADRSADEDEILHMAGQALRNIAISYVDLDDDPKRDWESPKPDETEKFILIGFLGIEDPVRPEVPEAVRQCQKAGIKVRMVTGDNAVTAKNIAQKCGIYHPDQGGLVMEGPEFRKLKDKEHELNAVIFKLDVLARSSPLDKQILVDALKKQHEVVAVTGDGTNDGPALKLAHVGFSMGITGTEVAKEASDIVLMDDNFSSIVAAVSWGRNVYDSIRKFIQFQLTVNIVAVVLAFIGSLTDEEGESPLRPVQLLWVNLIMDTMAALALATERPAPSLLDRPPYGKNAPLISAMMWKNILGQAFFQFVINFYCLYRPDSVFGPAPDGSSLLDKQNDGLHKTLFFNTFVMCQLFNEINSRKIHGELNVFSGFFNSPLFLAVMGFTLCMQYAMVQFGGEWVGCVPLNEGQWLRTIAIGALGLPMSTLIRLLPTVSMPQRQGASRHRWQKAISQTQKQLSVVERFRRKHSIEHHSRRKISAD